MNEIRKKEKEINERLIKDRIVRDITTLFKKEDDVDYFKPWTIINFPL